MNAMVEAAAELCGHWRVACKREIHRRGVVVDRSILVRHRSNGTAR